MSSEGNTYDVDDPGVPNEDGESWQDVVDRRTHDWELGLGAVLYNDRPDRPGDRRDLWHVTKRLVDHDGDSHLYEIQDGTHTSVMYYHHEDVLADFAPAGWCWPTSRKPLYHLTRECGVDDPADLMTDGGQAVGGTDRTEETLSYAAAPEDDGGMVTVTVSTTGDEGIRGHDSDEVEVVVPFEGALSIDIESEEVELTPNSFDGNPVVER